MGYSPAEPLIRPRPGIAGRRRRAYSAAETVPTSRVSGAAGVAIA